MVEKLKSSFSLEVISALATWAVVALSAMYLMFIGDKYSNFDMSLAGLLFCSFIGLWFYSTAEPQDNLKTPRHVFLLGLQYLIIIALYFTVPYTYTAILVTLWCTLLPYTIPFKWAVLSSPIWSAPLWLVFSLYWQQNNMFVSATLFLMFNLFALIMINTTIKERKAREEANQLNRELLATQSLLKQASQQAERVRIARNIHDLLGHHLTALTINLQVASRITQGEAKERVEQCHSLSKLLLSDVREAVSEIRDKSNIELKAALQLLLHQVPRLNIEMNYADDLVIKDVEHADTIIRCVQETLTNCLKHSRASHFSLSLKQCQQKVLLQMRDNGEQIFTFVAGNGLTGIKERVKQLEGTLSIESKPNGFHTHIELPAAV
jgi:signal transduction histidine kinase